MDIQETGGMAGADDGRGDGTAARQRRFEALLAAHRGIVAKVAASYTRDAHERADLAQEIAAQLWRAFPGYDPQRSFSTWMYRIALNVAISQLRGRREDAIALEEEHAIAGDGDEDADIAQRLRALRRLIAAQPPLDRALLLLYLEERSHREIGEVLGLSESNVATKINRLKQRLRAGLAG